jgi:RNA polymerase sigma-70 factor (ECF subfamily)
VVDARGPTFDETFRAEYAGIVRVVAPIVGSVEDAEAVVQDAFLKAFVRWRRIGGYDKPGAWVQRIAVRDGVRFATRARRSPPGSAATSGDPAGATATRVDLSRALAELPARPRAAVVLHHLAGWPVSEVAATLGCAEGTVRAHLHRGRQALATRPELEEVDSDGNR